MNADPDLIKATIAAAHDAGSTVAIHLRGLPEHRFQGLIQDLSNDAFALYHVGSEFGVRWAIRYADVLAAGLLTPVHADLVAAGCAHPCP